VVEEEYPERTTDNGQATGFTLSLAAASGVHPFCNLQSWARTHAILVIGLYELLGNPTTKLIEPPGPPQIIEYKNKHNIQCMLMTIPCRGLGYAQQCG